MDELVLKEVMWQEKHWNHSVLLKVELCSRAHMVFAVSEAVFQCLRFRDWTSLAMPNIIFLRNT